MKEKVVSVCVCVCPYTTKPKGNSLANTHMKNPIGENGAEKNLSMS